MYQKRTNKETKESAVSPVVGVMLMLVVTIVIAAVVTVFASGLVTTQKAAPTITIDPAITNGGEYYNSYFDLKVISVSEPIKTSDLLIKTTWYNATSGKNQVTTTGDLDGNWTIKYYGITHNITNAPWGYGPGVSNVNTGVPGNPEQEFGNYTLVGETLMHAYPAGQDGGYVSHKLNDNGGYTGYEYTGTYFDGTHNQVDGMQSILGMGWEMLRSGDMVNVKLIYSPTNTIIYDKDVMVS